MILPLGFGASWEFPEANWLGPIHIDMTSCWCFKGYFKDILEMLRSINFWSITLTKEFCAQPLRHVWLMFIHKAEVEKDN